MLSEEERAAKKAEKNGQKGKKDDAGKKEKLNFDDIDGPDDYFERLKSECDRKVETGYLVRSLPASNGHSRITR